MAVVAPWKAVTTSIRAGIVALMWAAALVAVPFSGARAQTTVGGAIAANTTWTASQGPYVVSADVTVQNGAQLTIEAGTTIYMGAGRSLSVQSGAIRAVGTASAKITVTSDRLRTGETAAPGDWQNWMFAAGTTNTLLERVIIEYGAGVVVNGSSPTFNYLDVRHHAGPAVRIDLSASPAGIGNTAIGNQQNAILVPAGDISGNVTWGLRGIPYLVASGTVSVGASPTVISVAPNSIEQGETRTLTVTGSRLTGAAKAQFGAAGVTAELLSGGSATQLQLAVTAAQSAVLGQTDLTLLVDAGKAKRTAALNVIGPQFKLTSATPSTVFVGQGPVGLELNGARFTSDAVARANGVDLSTTFVSSNRLRATLPNQTAIAALALSVRQPDPVNPSEFVVSADLPIAVATPNLLLAPAAATFISGATQNLTLTLPYPAQSGGQSINLVSSVPGVASVPATVAIAEGGSSVTVLVTTLSTGSTTITASRAGFTSAQSVLTVVPPPTLTITPPSLIIGAGRTHTLSISSSAVAPAGGIALSLSSSAESVATAPASALIPAGASSTSVSLFTVSVGTATISAAAAGHVTGTSAITVRPVSINFPSGALVAPGLSRSIPLSLSDPAPAGGLEITLASSNAGVATVAASVTVPAGQSAANITLTGVSIGSATVSATAAGYQQGTLPVTVDAVNISLGVTTTSLPAGMTHIYTLTLSRPAPLGGVTVSLATANSTLATVSPAVIEIGEGQTSGGVVKVALTGVATGSTTLSASAPGLNAANVTVNITPPPAISFNRSTVAVGKNLQTYLYELYAQLRTGGSIYNPPSGATVNLMSSDPTKAGVPATLSFSPNDGTAYFRVAGVDLTGATPVTIDATATGYTAPATQLAVNVVTPQLNIQSLDISRSPAGQRDNFRFYVSVSGGATYAQNQTVVGDTPIDVAITDAAPAGIVDGFYSALTGGTAITQVLLRADNTYTDFSYVGVPTVAGAYRVQASIAGVATATSGVVTVDAPELRFSRSAVIAGSGLTTYLYEVYVYRAVNGQSFNGTTPISVNLTCSSTAICSVPATVTIPANESVAYIPVSGIGLGTTTITATAIGYNSVQDLNVSVIAPTLRLSGLVSSRTVGQTDAFTVGTTVPGTTYATNHTATAPITVSLTSSAPDVGTVTSETTVAAAAATSSNATFTAVGAGATSVTASSTGFQSVSGSVTVSP